MKRAPSPPNSTNHHCSFSPSPLSSPSLLPSPTSSSSSSSYFSPSYHQPTTFSTNDDRPPAPERRRSSGGFPRSQPLRPMLGLTSLAAGGATAPSEKPQLIPINGMKAGPGKGKVKMLVGRTMKVSIFFFVYITGRSVVCALSPRFVWSEGSSEGHSDQPFA
ncbi:hypothetical protein BDY24DRAFT_187326 [Mrakia frigida]|uniref:uncharacterized protein n=1 Tax=Mrakia frigida TaxID=29902 RepID=UPI003FCBF281